MSIGSKIALAMSADGASFEEIHSSLEKLINDFAIGFAEWLKLPSERNEFFNDLKTTKELLEIYKKEKGL